MSNKRYLEIDSTYRNREQYTNPSNFTILIAQSGSRDAIHAYDPVSDAAPIKTWKPQDLELSGKADNDPTNTKSRFVLQFEKKEDASKDPDYYAGYPITLSAAPSETVIIRTWTYLSSSTTDDYFIVQITPDLSFIPTNETVSFSGTVNDYAQGTFFVPDGYGADYYYVDQIIYNETIALTNPELAWRKFISYDGTNKLAGFDTTVPVTGGTSFWGKDHVYSIRKKPPQYIGTLAPPVAPQPDNTYTTFTVPADTIVRPGDFIRFTTPEKEVTCRVVKYTGEGQVANPNANPPTTTIYPYIVTVACVLPFIPEDQTFEVLQFSYDNAVPFTYTGSTVSQQEMVCYEIELVNLILPNKTLQSGGRTAFYPYLHVELQNVSGASSGNTNIIYSNNPSTRKMLFRAAMDDIPNPVISPFIKIDGDGMTQTIKFKPNDNLKFGVYLPNGEPLQTVDSDTSSPVPPDPLVQVSALFAMKRL